jgi:hypothetical protein
MQERTKNWSEIDRNLFFYQATKERKQGKAVNVLLLESVGAFVLGFCFVGFLYLSFISN